MTDRVSEQPPANAHQKNLASAPAAYPSADSVDSHAQVVGRNFQPPQAGALLHRPAAVNVSAIRAAEKTQISIGIVGFLLAIGAAWMTFGSSSSWFKQAPYSQPGPTPAFGVAQLDASCGAPITAVAQRLNGRLPLQTDLKNFELADIDTFIGIGKEAAAVGRQRDAESAFLMSCRIAEKLAGADSVEAGRAKYQLGALYAQLVINGTDAGDAATRQELIRRASLLYAEGLRLSALHADLRVHSMDLARNASLISATTLVSEPLQSEVVSALTTMRAPAVSDASAAALQDMPPARPVALVAPRLKPRPPMGNRPARRPAPVQKVFAASGGTNFDELFRGR